MCWSSLGHLSPGPLAALLSKGLGSLRISRAAAAAPAPAAPSAFLALPALLRWLAGQINLLCVLRYLFPFH